MVVSTTSCPSCRRGKRKCDGTAAGCDGRENTSPCTLCNTIRTCVYSPQCLIIVKSLIENYKEGTSKICRLCSTNETPRWRGQLCNVCGLYFQRLKRRAQEKETIPPHSFGSSRGLEEYPPARMSCTAKSTAPEVQPSQSATPARLLGHGLAPHPYQLIAGPSTSAIPIESRFSGSHPPRRSESPQYYCSRSPREPHSSVRYPTSQQSHWHQRERDPLRTLPPLVPSLSYSTRRTHAPSSSLPSRITDGLPYPISPESRFRHISPEISSRPSINLPPPFAMQPSSQWNPIPHSSPFRSDPRHIPSCSLAEVERSIPTVTARCEGTMEVSTDPPQHDAPPPHSTSPPSLPFSRLGRYDPVRATFITRSTPTPTAA